VLRFSFSVIKTLLGLAHNAYFISLQSYSVEYFKKLPGQHILRPTFKCKPSFSEAPSSFNAN
ncbi:hypothetical protein OAW67_00885, partial [Planktomarina sp.]|nr:hypothetical protein [Planktomarina sp.]